jgi:hypothetical protein
MSNGRDDSLLVAAVIAAYQNGTEMTHSDSHKGVVFFVFLKEVGKRYWSFEYKAGDMPIRTGGEFCPRVSVAIEEGSALARRAIDEFLSRKE